MAKETMQLGEGFKAEKISGTPPPPDGPKPRHYVIGYSVIVAVLSALAWWFTAHHAPVPLPASMHESPGFGETLGKRLGGVLSFQQIRAGSVIREWGPFHNTIVNAGETALRDCFNANAGSACTGVVAVFKYHGLGTSSAAINETNTGCTTELTTQYAVDSTRPTGTQTTNGANVYQTVGTNTVDAGVTIEEFCLMSAASAGTMWTRILTGTVVLASGDTLQTTYSLTIE